jgi:hypothetical protein
MSKQRINRREFLAASATLAGAAVPGLAWSAGRVCPSSGLAGASGKSDGEPCGPAGQLPGLSLTSRASSGLHAWTVGHPFRQGDVPPAMVLTADDDNFQSDVRNRWPDGSAKFAVLSGLAAFKQGVPRRIDLTAASGVDEETNVPEPDSLDVHATFSGAVKGTYALQSVLGVNKELWGSRASGGRVRTIPGPVMSEFHYYLPTSDDHVSLWFYVRRYADGATEVETVVENGWLLVPSPGQKDYAIDLVIAGRTRFSGPVGHLHHTRWSRVDWVDADPQIVPRHDPGYLRQTRMVPNYGYTSPSDQAFRTLIAEEQPAPFARGNWPVRMGAAGHSPSIGLLPNWEALYCTSADPRAYVAMVGNGRCAGRYPIHYRDESTGRVPLYASHPDLTLTSGWGRTRPPKPRGGRVDGGWAITHHPSLGYLNYIVTGRWPALESLQFSASFSMLESRPSTRQGGGVLACINAPLTTRGAAWAWRTMGQAAAISPTALRGVAPPAPDRSIQLQAAESIGDTAAWMCRRFVDGSIDGGVHRNSVGWLGQYGGSSRDPAPEWWGAGWMARFQSLALGHISDLGIENMKRPEDLVAVRNHSYEGTLRLIGNDQSWNWRRMALYRQPYLKDGSKPLAPVFMSTAEAFAAYRARHELSGLSAAPGGTLKNHSSDTDIRRGSSSNMATGFGAFPAAVLAMAVDHARPGAAAKYALVSTAPNFSPARAGAHDEPTWALVPR